MNIRCAEDAENATLLTAEEEAILNGMVVSVKGERMELKRNRGWRDLPSLLRGDQTLTVLVLPRGATQCVAGPHPGHWIVALSLASAAHIRGAREWTGSTSCTNGVAASPRRRLIAKTVKDQRHVHHDV